MTDDAAFYDRALRRMSRIAIGFAVVTVSFVAFRHGWLDAIGCATGATLSILNLGWWKRLVRGMGNSEKPQRPVLAVFLGLRYVLLGGICFVIIKFFGVSYLALIAGLLIPVAAVLAEIIFELVFTR